MAKCEFCDKGVTFGIKVSHSHRRTNRTWKPNVKRVKAIVDGSPKHVYGHPRCVIENITRNEPVPKRDGLFSVSRRPRSRVMPNTSPSGPRALFD